MTNPVDLINEEIAKITEQLEIDVKKVSLLQQEIKAIQEEAQKAINEKQTQINSATQPILENQGSLKKLTELKNKLEGKIEATTEK
jgi:chromosome segregation ATPase|tara:strand:- start:94 stop:351 length:258 start_codon:yes stop_codon:yes gene_type:complete